MKPVLFNENVSGALITDVDTVIVELHDATAPYGLAESMPGILNTTGNVSVTFTVSGSYYIVVKHRNMIEIWSSTPQNITGTLVYDFTTSATQAYQNQAPMDPPPYTLSPQLLVESSPVAIYAAYNGDVALGDGICDVSDFNDMEGAAAFYAGNPVADYYITDVTGDGYPDVSDFNVLESNVSGFIERQYPQ